MTKKIYVSVEIRRQRMKIWDANTNVIENIVYDEHPSDTCDYGKKCDGSELKEFDRLGTFCERHFLTLPGCSNDDCGGIAVPDNNFNPNNLCRECMLGEYEINEREAANGILHCHSAIAEAELYSPGKYGLLSTHNAEITRKQREIGVKKMHPTPRWMAEIEVT